jgi:tRNA pseudouridine synthase 10
MAAEAAALLGKEDAAGFSISTLIPKDWLIREEDVWDVRAGQSIKDFLNRKLSSALEMATGLPYMNDGDCRAVFDFSTGKTMLERNDLFIFGRYLKLTPGLSQSRWLCSRCNGKGCEDCGGKGKNYESVEEKIGEPLKKAAEADEYVMHASGREDVDATNTAGRPFVLMLRNPKKRKPDLAVATAEIAANGCVEVTTLRFVRRSFVEVVTESHFDKGYEASVEFGRQLTDDDVAKISGMQGKTLAQQTPRRVIHRRADLVRHRKVKAIEITSTGGNTAVLRITAEAGTYIKEFVSGDDGRTEPSIAGLLKTSAKCTKLVVEKIEDGFLDLCLSA